MLSTDTDPLPAPSPPFAGSSAPGPPSTGRFTRAAPVEVLFGTWSAFVATAILAGAVLGALAIGDWSGDGPTLCWFRGISGLPCPGCGLTRAVIHLARGELTRSFVLHPFGVPVLAWACVAATGPLWPRSLKRRVEAWLEDRRQAVDRSYRVLVYSFVGYGALRLLVVALGYWPTV